MKTVNYSDHFGNENTSLEPAASVEDKMKLPFPEYNIPEKETKTWCSYMEKGFRASRIMTDNETANDTDNSKNMIREYTSSDKLQPDNLKK